MNDHDYNQNPEPAHSGMETAAIILGILALIGSTCFYLSIPCAAIGILLALLSRGRKEHMSTRAKTGLCISAAGLVLTVGLTSYTVYHYKDLFSSPEFQQRMKDYMEYYNSGSETEAQDNGESNILKDFFGNDEDGNSSVETGDTSLLMVIIAMLVVSAGIFSVTVSKRKKIRSNNESI